jgi:hypothetical protein
MQGAFVGIFDSSDEHPPAKVRRYVITGIAFVALIVILAAYLFRFHQEEATVRHFLDTVVAGNMEEAYKLWKPAPSYSFKDFQDDWGPQSLNGGIKSYRIGKGERMPSASGVVFRVELSPFQPFPSENDVVKSNKTNEVRLWVQFKDQSIGFSPF